MSTGRAGASVASIDDPSALAVNPAGLSKTKGTVIHVGTSLISYHQTMSRSGVYEATGDADLAWEGQPYGSVSDKSTPAIGLGPFQAVPVISVSSDLGGLVKGLVVAAGVVAPNAYPDRSMGADYELEDPNAPPPPTRYDIVEQQAAIVLPSIGVAYHLLDKVRIGGRFSFGFADLEARTFVWGAQNYDEYSGKDGEFSVKVKDSFVPAWAVGAQYLVSPSFEVGFQYQSAIHVNAKGTGTSKVGSDAIEGSTVTVVPVDGLGTNFCETGGTAEALKACINLSLPQMLNLGGRYIFRDADDREVADLELNVQWENWGGTVTQDGAERPIGDYQVIVDGFASIAPGVGLQLNPSLIRHNLQDTFSFRLGGSYRLPLAGNTLVVRGGVAYDTVAAKDGWQRVDFDGAARLTTTAGASLVLSRVSIDVGVGKVFEGTREQGTGCNPTVSDPGCGSDGDALPVEDRVGPDPVQPTSDSSGQVENPFTGGTISSGYNLLMLGVTTWF